MPTRKRMLPMDRRARSKKRMRPKRRKKTPDHAVRANYAVCVRVRLGFFVPPLQKATPTSVHHSSVKCRYRLVELHRRTYSANRKAIVSACLPTVLSSDIPELQCNWVDVVANVEITSTQET
jgi:hypothetical protein